MADFPYVLTVHATISMRKRPMPLEWVRRAVEHPERVEVDADDPALRHGLVAIPEHDDRVLRVIYNPTVEPYRIVTFFFDRGMKGKL